MMSHRSVIFIFVITSLFGSHSILFAQSEPIYTQHYNNQPITNSAFTGFRNTLSIDVSVRRQWIGIPGAPRSQFLSVHSPINKTKLSVGAHIHSWQNGPIKNFQSATHYSYLARLGDRMFLSLGMNVGYLHYSLDPGGLIVVDGNDPHFTSGSISLSNATIGAGWVLFTPHYYIGMSRPNVAIYSQQSSISSPTLEGAWYAMGGASITSIEDFTPKISLIGRRSYNGQIVFDITGRVFYRNRFGTGISIRPKHSWALLMDIRFNSNLSVTYSFEHGMSNAPYYASNSHEITLSYDVYRFIKRNKYRQFKKKKELDDSQMRSIRYF